MLCHRSLIFYVLIVACVVGSLKSLDIEDEALKEFEERIDRLRRSFDGNVGVKKDDEGGGGVKNDDDGGGGVKRDDDDGRGVKIREENDHNGGVKNDDEDRDGVNNDDKDRVGVNNDDEDVPNEASGEEPIHPINNNEDNSNSINNVASNCCKMGETMATLGLDCSNKNLLYMTRRQKVQALSGIFHELGIDINDKTRLTLYTPFRLCLMKDTKSLMKGCVTVSRLSKERHSNKDIRSMSRRASYGFNRRFDVSLNRYRSRGPCTHRRCPGASQPRNRGRKQYRYAPRFRG